MIKLSERKIIGSCDNCNREMLLLLQYEFLDVKSSNKMPSDKPYITLCLCEDCSNALGNLYHKVMENLEPHKYHLDEITKI